MNLTDLEQAALGVVWRDGPCTAYEVRKEFQESPSPGWSGSAGTIYPLVRRLEGLGLLESRDATRDRRGTRLLAVTAAGRRALKAWFRPPLPPETIAPGVDLLRTRLLFLDVLSASERRAFLDVVGRQLDAAVKELRGAGSGSDRLLALATRGGLLVARARQRWFREVRDHFDRG